MEDFALSRDGTRLVFRADAAEDESFELFSSPADASGPPVPLNAPLVAGGDVVRFALGRQRAAYIADQDTDEVFELYSAPIPGGTVLKLSAGGNVTDVLLTPDGLDAVFLVGPEFFRVPLDGSAAPRALDPSPSEQEVVLSRMSPLGTRILFTRREVTFVPPFFLFHSDRLFSLALDGSPSKVLIAEAHPLSGGSFEDRSFVDVEFSPDGQHALYTDLIDEEDEPSDVKLYSATVDGSQAPILLSRGTDNTHLPFAVSASIARAVFLELGNAYSIALDGSGRVQLDPTGWSTQSTRSFLLTPDGTSVLFDATNSAVLRGLLQARIDGSQPAHVLAGPGDFTITEIAPTDTRAFYSARNGPSFEFLGFTGVYSVPLDGSSAPLLLNGPVVERTGGNSLQPTNGGELLFRNSYSVDSNLELYAVPQDGSMAPHRISAAMSNGRDVDRYLQTPESGVVYRADQTLDGAFELFLTSVQGSKPRNFLPLSPGPVVGDVFTYRVSPDGRSVVFLADQESDEEFRSYYVPSSGKTAPTRLGRFFFPSAELEYAFPLVGNRVVEFNNPQFRLICSVDTAPGSLEVLLGGSLVSGPMEFTPDGARAVFKLDMGVGGSELWSAAMDGSSSPVPLFRVSRRVVHDYEPTPDGRTVVFVADALVQAKFELFRIPVAGGAPATRLNPALPPNGNVEGFRVTPDGTGVVYLAGQRGGGRTVELFVVPLDLGPPPRRLNGPLITPGDVADFVFTPDGRNVVYRADAVVDSRFDLFRVPLAPSAPGFGRALGTGEPGAVQLTFGTRRVEPDYRVAVDGTQVVYRTDVRTGMFQLPRYELFRVPLSGGEAPGRLSLPVDVGGSVLSFELSPDTKHVVYLAEEGDGVQELFSVGASGGEVVALDPLPAFADVTTYGITPDSTGVLYLSDRDGDEDYQLFRAPLDGSAPPVALNDPLPPGGDVLSDFTALPGGSVLYRADQAADDVFELFATGSRAMR